MQIFTEIIGNANDPQWAEKLKDTHIENIFLDQWTAQKSRFVATGDHGNEYPIALKRKQQIKSGDIISYNPDTREAVVLQLALNPVMVFDLSSLVDKTPEQIISTAVELGHAIGNQHWPAVVKGTKLYVPLTVDKKVMESVMETHHIEGVAYAFHEGSEVIPYMAPHEIRRLFGGASHESHSHVH